MRSRRLPLILSLFLLLLTCSCAKSDRGSAAELVKQVATEVRPKMRVEVMIRASADEPTQEDQALLRSIETAIERKNLGTVVSSGSRAGHLFVTVEVDNTADATSELRTILQKAGVRERSSMKVIQPSGGS